MRADASVHHYTAELTALLDSLSYSDRPNTNAQKPLFLPTHFMEVETAAAIKYTVDQGTTHSHTLYFMFP